jgi:hypothetical protein
MKILVLAQSRSGSTGFQAWLKSEFNEPVMLEPFNHNLLSQEELDLQLETLKSNNGLILKFVDNMYLNMPYISDVNVLMSHFDKVIGLTRDNDYECAYSRLMGHLSDNWRGSRQSIKVDQKIIDSNLFLMDDYINHAKHHKTYIRSLPIFQTTYEKIYQNKDIGPLIDYLEIKPKNLDYLFENKNITGNWNMNMFEYHKNF